ncbi:MAG: Six-hairpin glycosidase-like protein [Proteobacteria bacterium]|nr:Six-hairpin glycosidase-like protein [Pseudomonadota bacterium]
MIAPTLMLLASLAAVSPQSAVDWRGQHAGMSRDTDGGFTLRGPFGERAIPPPAWSARTASPLFDGLFALAQDDLRQDSVEAIRDAAFDHGQAIACHCFETGAKWHYVWTRDVSYAIDLGLWRYDRARAVNSLAFKLSGVRGKDAAQGSYPMQDTGSGGSWPISTDRVVWFLAARHLLDDTAFAGTVWPALIDTLAQDREYAFDERMGLYRGETSFLDWREQSYPSWTRDDVVFIAQSFALSTNVLHYTALRLAERLARQRGDARAADYGAQAQALQAAINARFWRGESGLYASYLGGDGLAVEAYDLLGLSLAITSGVADAGRARASLAHYPAWPAGSPVIWPERADEPIYHNRAIWPFVSAYALRAARAVDDPALIAFQIQSLMRGAALAGSNMENYELVTQATHVEDGQRSGPVVDSPRQLWSVAAYLDMVGEGVFGLSDDGRIEPKLPVSLVPMLFGKHVQIALQLPDRRIVLQRPRQLHGNLLIADIVRRDGTTVTVALKAIEVPALAPRTAAPLYAPSTPPAPTATRIGDGWSVRTEDGRSILYVDGARLGAVGAAWTLPASHAYRCLRLTRRDNDGIESLPSAATCIGDEARIGGTWPRQWTAPATGDFRAALDYSNDNGPINTGITAAVRRLAIRCGENPERRFPIVMPHSVGERESTIVRFRATAGASCTFALQPGFNMSDLANFAHYTGGAGGSGGPLDAAVVGALRIAPLPGGDAP